MAGNVVIMDPTIFPNGDGNVRAQSRQGLTVGGQCKHARGRVARDPATGDFAMMACLDGATETRCKTVVDAVTGDVRWETSASVSCMGWAIPQRLEWVLNCSAVGTNGNTYRHRKYAVGGPTPPGPITSGSVEFSTCGPYSDQTGQGLRFGYRSAFQQPNSGVVNIVYIELPNAAPGQEYRFTVVFGLSVSVSDDFSSASCSFTQWFGVQRSDEVLASPGDIDTSFEDDMILHLDRPGTGLRINSIGIIRKTTSGPTTLQTNTEWPGQFLNISSMASAPIACGFGNTVFCSS